MCKTARSDSKNSSNTPSALGVRTASVTKCEKSVTRSQVKKQHSSRVGGIYVKSIHLVSNYCTPVKMYSYKYVIRYNSVCLCESVHSM